MNTNFKNTAKNGLLYEMQRSGRWPIDPESVVTSYQDLKDILTERLNIYPGQTIALADDVTDSGITLSPTDRKEEGIYWITNQTAGETDLVAYRLATTKEVQEGSSTSYNTLWNTIRDSYTNLYNDITSSYTQIWNTVNVSYNNIYKEVTQTVIPYSELTREMLLAMLPDMEYFAPQASDFGFAYLDDGVICDFEHDSAYNSCYLKKTYGDYGPGGIRRLTFKWMNTAPYYQAEDYIYKYTSTNSRLPDDFKLSFLGYTQCLSASSTQYNPVWQVSASEFSESGTPSQLTTSFYITRTLKENQKSNTGISSIETISICDGKTRAAGGANQCMFNMSSLTPSVLPADDTSKVPTIDILTPSSTSNPLMFSGKLTLATLNATVYYAGPQKTFVKSLADQNIFVESTKKMWSKDSFAFNANNKITLSKSLTLYVGFPLYYGLFSLSSDLKNESSNYEDILKYIINSTGTKPSALSNFKKSGDVLVTSQSNTGLSTTANTWNYYGSSNIGTTSWGSGAVRNCCFIGFPTAYFNYVNNNTSTNQVWWCKFSGTAAWSLFPTSDGDSNNYIINTDIKVGNTSVSVPYTFIVAKSTLEFKFGGASDSGFGLKLQCNQKGLNTLNK